MHNTRLDPRLLTVGELFDDSNAIYTVPIYQRNYAWQAEQIEQLMRDIQDAIGDKESSYFLGNLMVTELQSSFTGFEVIDGQQRLTTLYLLQTFLAESGDMLQRHQGRLRYESRPRATETLRRISSESLRRPAWSAQGRNAEDAAILQGYNVIRQFMGQHVNGDGERRKFADFLLTKVKVVRASLPRKTDFNRYFEIMNTRGQQLRQADIVKARLMHHLADDAERACFAWIWEACSDMDSYVQMSLTRGDMILRNKIFGGDWSWLTSASFEQLVGFHGPADGVTSTDVRSGTSLTLDEALAKYAEVGATTDSEDQDNVRFRSTIEFPAFLLHVLEVMTGDGQEVEGRLDDKALIHRFETVLKDYAADKAQWVRQFAFRLLRCRNLFDGFILKRQYSAANSDEGDWSLQRLIKRRSRDRMMPGYENTLSIGSGDVEEDGDVDSATNELLMLQSMLRVTYTSPRTMHWITRVLKFLDERHCDRLTHCGLADVLRDYARAKVAEAWFSGEEPQGFSINRIVFTYLDFLLWTDEKNPEFRFSFRNSIEHFYPQHPDEQQSGSGKELSGEWLHRLGNLALVSVGSNSKFSNSMPSAKAHNFKHTIELQSIKLHKMAEITRKSLNWDEVEIRRHHHEMIERLRYDLSCNTLAAAGARRACDVDVDRS
ncbi:DUF262 domain-containing protein [Caballeronia grimmiae]|uniref:DUF262 domain-containing protein n=1 Tax=Caballeronia grimmiae TaxID=1071679 RepID=UPI0038B908BE